MSPLRFATSILFCSLLLSPLTARGQAPAEPRVHLLGAFGLLGRGPGSTLEDIYTAEGWVGFEPARPGIPGFGSGDQTYPIRNDDGQAGEVWLEVSPLRAVRLGGIWRPELETSVRGTENRLNVIRSGEWALSLGYDIGRHLLDRRWSVLAGTGVVWGTSSLQSNSPGGGDRLVPVKGNPDQRRTDAGWLLFGAASYRLRPVVSLELRADYRGLPDLKYTTESGTFYDVPTSTFSAMFGVSFHLLSL